MLAYTDTDLESLLDPDAVIAALRDAFGRGYAKVRMPPRMQLDLGSAIILFMPCAVAGQDICGTKIVRVSQDSRPEERITSTYVLIDTRIGQTVAVLAANFLTDLRTAATSVIATDSLAWPTAGREPPERGHDASTLGIFGTGRQAKAHIALFSQRRQFQRILVVGRTPEKTRAFATRMREKFGVQIIATDASTCASTADVICTCTSSTQPLFDGELVRPGTHLNLIGTFQPHAREVDSTLMRRARVFVDTYEGCLAEAGDILVPLNAGEIGRDHIKADLHELVTDTKAGRTSPNDITLFKSVGCALEDLATARLLLNSINP